MDIATAANLNVVCRLGGFHILMNFLGASGYVMKGSGIEELLSLLYGPSTVDHVMSGKAFARALRGHCIVHNSLVQRLLQYVVGDESQRNNSAVLQVDGDCPLDVEDVDIITCTVRCGRTKSMCLTAVVYSLLICRASLMHC